jgi:hypothetical protein
MRITNDNARGLSNVGLALLAAATGLAALSVSPTRGNAQDIIARFDQSQIIRLPRPVAEIIIGNPMIADVAIQSSNLLVVTGKSFGLTNIIALDADRNVILDQRVMVQRDSARLLYLTKAGKRQTYNCSPQCNPTLTVGDDNAYFEATARTSQQKIRMTEGQTDGASMPAQQ